MSEQATPANPTVPAVSITQAVQAAIQAGCLTKAAIVSHVQAAIGKIPSPTLISMTRKKMNVKSPDGRGRPRKSAEHAVKPAKAVAVNKARSASCSAPCTQLDGVSAKDLVDISNAVKPFVAKLGFEKFVHVVSVAGKL